MENLQNYYWRTSDGAYTRSAPAHPGSLPPQNAIRIAPPQGEPGVWPQINEDMSGWNLVEDHRGREGYIDSKPTKVVSLGPLPDGWSDSPPEISDARTPEEIAARRRAEIMGELTALDSGSIRALRALQAGTGSAEDKQRLKEIEDRTAALRKQLAEIK